MTKLIIERWTGKAWYPSMCSPYKTMSDINKHLKDYWWHYTKDNPYRITEYKEKKKKRYNNPFNMSKWIRDDESMMVVKI